MRTDLEGRRQGLRSLPVVSITVAMSLVVLLPMSVDGQPSSGGALRSIGGIAKHKIFRELDDGPESTKAAVAGDVELEVACSLSSAALAMGCTKGAYRCGPKISVPCGGFDEGAGGLDFVAAGTGLRHVEESNIALRGAPVDAQAVEAWLYWGALVPASQTGLLREIELEGYSITGRVVGVTKEPCWDRNSLFVLYSASVLPYLASGINGDYALDLPALGSEAKTDGSDPWDDLQQDGSVRLEGSSLVVVYQHAEVPPKAQIHVHEGPEMLVGSLNVQHRLQPPAIAGTEVRHLRLGGDGQTYASRRQPVAPFRTLISFADQPWIELRGSTSLIDRFSDWQGTDGGSFSQLWDTHVTHASASELGLQGGVSGYAIRYETEKPVGTGSKFLYDCVEIGVHLLGIR